MTKECDEGNDVSSILVRLESIGLGGCGACAYGSGLEVDEGVNEER